MVILDMVVRVLVVLSLGAILLVRRNTAATVMMDAVVQTAAHGDECTIGRVNEFGVIIANGGLDLIVCDHEPNCDGVNVGLGQLIARDRAFEGHQQG